MIYVGSYCSQLNLSFSVSTNILSRYFNRKKVDVHWEVLCECTDWGDLVICVICEACLVIRDTCTDSLIKDLCCVVEI